MTTNVFHTSGQFYSEDFSSFDKLVFKRKKQNGSADIFSELDSWVFHFGGEKSSADNFGVEHLSYFDCFDFRRKNNCSADSFSQLDVLVFHIGGEFYSTDNFDDDLASSSTKY